MWNIHKEYTNISDEELRGIVAECSTVLPNAGERMILGYLKSLGLYVQRHRYIMTVAV